MDRGERREINKRKWHNKLKSIFNARAWERYRMQRTGGSDTEESSDMIQPKTWKDMLKTKDGVAYKETGTMWHNPKTEKDEYSDKKDLHKRDMENKSLSKEEQEELELAVETMDNPYAFENYCGACDHFGIPEECPFFEKVNDHTEWKKIKCIDFWD